MAAPLGGQTAPSIQANWSPLLSASMMSVRTVV
jgi:hypothetical protein